MKCHTEHLNRKHGSHSESVISNSKHHAYVFLMCKKKKKNKKAFIAV